jgi:ankyrin repeat protein
VKATDHVVFIDSNCTDVSSNSSRNPLVLLCGTKNQSSSSPDLPCHCPTPDQLLFATKINANTKTIVNKTMCSIYNLKNLNASIRLVIPRGEAMKRFDSWGPLLILSRFYWQNNLMDLVHRLVSNNTTNVTATTPEGDNALMLLLRYSKSDKIYQIAQLFLAKGIDVNQKEQFYQNNALLLLSEYSESDQLFELIKLVIEKGVNVNHTNIIQHNALMNLCRHSNNIHIDKIAKLLLRHGIDINQNLEGSHALSLLCEYSKSQKIVQVAKLLIDNGIDINMKDGHGNNALMNLCAFSKSEQILQVAQLLIENGINIRSRDNDQGDNALMLLCRFSKSDRIVEMAKLLIDNGIDVNQTNEDGNNALMLLCSSSKSEHIVQVIELLIAKGINVKQKNNQGKNAIDLLKGPSSIFATLFAADDAIRPKKPQIFELLIKAANNNH